MAAKTDAYELELLALIFQNSAIALVGDSSGIQPSGAAGSLYVSLHTSSPGEAGVQTTNEAAYTGYARVAVARSGAGWTVSGGVADNTAVVTFGTHVSGTETITHAGIGSSSTGTGLLLYYGPLTASLVMSAGVIPSFAIGDLNVQEV